MNIHSKELSSPVSSDRIKELEDCFWSETNDEWTQEWRDDLTPAETALVDEWDRGYDSGINKLITAIVAVSERNKQRLLKS